MLPLCNSNRLSLSLIMERNEEGGPSEKERESERERCLKECLFSPQRVCVWIANAVFRHIVGSNHKPRKQFLFLIHVRNYSMLSQKTLLTRCFRVAAGGMMPHIRQEDKTEMKFISIKPLSHYGSVSSISFFLSLPPSWFLIGTKISTVETSFSLSLSLSPPPLFLPLSLLLVSEKQTARSLRPVVDSAVIH